MIIHVSIPADASERVAKRGATMPVKSVAIGIVVALFGLCGQASAKQTCESLASLKLPNATITMAQPVAAGAFVPPPGAAFGPPGTPTPDFKSLPAFCRVAATIKPTQDSDIKVEVWMPAAEWSGRLLDSGEGAYAGVIDYGGLFKAVQLGSASASTDTGHAIPNGNMTDVSWALGHPEKVKDFGYRGIHEMTQLAKSVIKAFYGNEPRHSYFESCSNGGRQALMEAQRFPQDYDGILAGAPANYWSRLAIWTIELTPLLDHGGYIPPAKIAAIARAVDAACDARDGVGDGILNDPRTCRFDPASIQCKSGESDQCLTQPQVAALRAIYAGPHDSQGRALYPGYMPGGEDGPNGWAQWIMGPAPGKAALFALGRGGFADMIFEKPDWDFKQVGVDEATKTADAKIGESLNAIDPDLTAFKARGGKLILFHGWNDPALAPLNTVNYYDSVESRMGESTVAAFARLYMVPGMQHCDGGPGPDSFGQTGPTTHADPQHNIALALQQWVESGVAPASIIATKYVGDDPGKGVKMTRPLCPYPQAATWTGKGSTDDAANFVCKLP